MSIKIYVKYVKNNRDFHATKLNLPTGNLDAHNKEKVIQLFQQMKTEGKTIICVTHDEEMAKKADRIICLQKERG